MARAVVAGAFCAWGSTEGSARADEPPPSAPAEAPAAPSEGAGARPSSDGPRGGATDGEAREPVTPRVALRYDGWVDGLATLGLGAAFVGAVIFRDDLAASSCTICDGAPGSVSGVDDTFRAWLRRHDTTPAGTMSHVVAYGAAPVAAIGLGATAAAADRRGDELPVNGLLVLEAVTASLLVTEGVKLAVPRERPNVHAVTNEDERAALFQKADARMSFPSGHTSSVFAIAAAGGTVATMRGYRLAPLVWLSGAMLGVATGYLRIAADQHYVTDVLAGAAIGTTVGIGVPLLFHRPSATPSPLARLMGGARVATSEVPGGRVVSLGWSLE